MAHGAFRLFVKPTDQSPWGLVETFIYDDASPKRRERREAKLHKVRRCQMNWQYNYSQWINAAFSVEEQQDEFSRPHHIMGAKRDYKRLGNKPGTLPQRPCKALAKRKRKASKPKPKSKGKRNVKGRTKRTNPSRRLPNLRKLPIRRGRKGRAK